MGDPRVDPVAGELVGGLGPEPSDEVKALYIAALKEAYLNLRQRLNPDIRKVGGKEQAWADAAVALYRNGADPYDYVDYCFNEILKRHDDVYSNMVASLRMVDQYVADEPDRRAYLTNIVFVQAGTLKDELRRGRALRDILTDPEVALGGLFRFVTAYSMGHHDLLDRFKEDAVRMLLFKPYYKKLFEGQLPPEMSRV